MSTTTKTLKQIRLGDKYNPPRVPLPKEQSFPSSLASLPVWIVWELQWKPEDSKWVKMPHQLLPNGQARTKGWNAPGNQTTLATCLEWIRSKPGRETRWGVGFIGKEDGPCALDFDDVVDEAGNIKNPDVAAWVESTKEELFWERSVSGSGLHAFGTGLNLDGQGRNFPLGKGGGFETLVGNRYCAVTGDRFANSALELGDLSPIYKEVSREAKEAKTPENTGKMTGPATETPRKTGVSTPTSTGGKELREVLKDRARAYVDTLEPSVSGNQGHSALMKAAVVLVKGWGYGDPSRAGMWEEDGREIFEEYNARAMPPESPEQIAHKWKSAKEGNASEGKNFFADVLRDHQNFQARHSSSGSPHAAPSQAAKGDWGPIGTVEDDEAREVKEPPLHTLPRAVSDYIKNQAERMNAQPDFCALALLVFAGSMVGNAGMARMKDGRRISCVLWASGVGKPGRTKSPPMDELAKTITDEDSIRISEYSKKLRRWRKAKEKFERGEHGCPYSKPKPRMHTLYLNSFTIEKLGCVLADNPKGILLYMDEITQFVRSMNQYNAGTNADRSQHLSAWGSSQIKISRKNIPLDLVINRPHYGIVGTIQPDLLDELTTQKKGRTASDGFFDRFIFVYPGDLPPRGALDIRKNDRAEEAVKKIFRALIALDVFMKVPGEDYRISAAAWRDGDEIEGFNQEPTKPKEARIISDEEPSIQRGNLAGLEDEEPEVPDPEEYLVCLEDRDCIEITEKGSDAWLLASSNFAERRKRLLAGGCERLDGMMSKMESNYLRIANIIQHIWWAAGDANERNITAEAIGAAGEWVDYFIDHACKVYGVMAQQTLGKDAVVGLKWVRKQKGDSFARSHIRDGIREKLNRCPKRLDAVLNELETANVIRAIDLPKGQGRPPAKYEINPSLQRG